MQVTHADLAPQSVRAIVDMRLVECYKGRSNPKRPLCLLWPQQRTKFYAYIGSHTMAGALFEQAASKYDAELEAWLAEETGDSETRTEADFANVWIARMEEHMRKTFPNQALAPVEAVTFTVDGPNEGLLFSGLLLHGGTMDPGSRYFCESAEEPVTRTTMHLLYHIQAWLGFLR